MVDILFRAGGRPRILFSVCCCAAAFLSAGPVGAEPPARTLPVITRDMKAQDAARAAPAAKSPAGVRQAAPGPGAVKTAPPGAVGREAKAGRAGFSSNPFALEHRSVPPEKKTGKVVYSAEGERREQPLALGEEGKVTVSAQQASMPESRLTPARTPFSGGEHTLPYMDAKPPTEVNMQYKLGNNATTRLTVNPQDSSSPLYRPAESDKTVNAAGVYMDVDVRPDMKVQVGGEYCDIDSRVSSGASQGASVGVQWNF